MASWFIEQLGKVQAAEEQTQRDLDVVLQEVPNLRAELDR
jgi:hypothetical protein